LFFLNYTYLIFIQNYSCRFATYYSYVGQNASNPEFEPMKQFLLEVPQYAFALDSRERSSHPLLLKAKTQSDIEDQAVGLPYYKGLLDFDSNCHHYLVCRINLKHSDG
jgi:hypothetical protein